MDWRKSELGKSWAQVAKPATIFLQSMEVHLEQRGAFNTFHSDEPNRKIYTKISVQDSIPILSQTYH